MNILCIGGGHGLSKVLKSLDGLADNLTAIVTTTDNGGSTGRIREDKQQIAFGDIRRCISSLSKRNDFLIDLTEQRFESDNDLNGHCLGNIILSALFQYTGSSSKAIEIYSEMLNINSKIIPMTETSVDLIAKDFNNNTIFGECNIDKLSFFPKSLSLSKKVYSSNEAIQSIEEADIILFGPGSLLTSVLPVLMVENIKEAIKNTKANRIFIENIGLENSVVDKVSKENQIHKAIELIGYKFFDISLSEKGIEAITGNKLNNNENKHNQKDLEFFIKEFISSEYSKDYIDFRSIH